MYILENNQELTEDVKKAFQKNITNVLLRNDELTINSENYLKSVSYDDSKYNPETGNFIGEATLRTIDIKLINADELELENKEFEFLVGAENKNGTIEYINFGKFIIQKPEAKDVEGTVDFEAFDYMSKFNITYNHNLNENYTYFELVEDLCNQAGVEYSGIPFRNSDKIISKNPFINGEQCRFILKQIAKIAFSVAYIGQDNKLYIGFNNRSTEVDEQITTDNYFELEPNNETKPITIITLRSSEVIQSSVSVRDEENIELYGKNELIIEEDYFSYSDDIRLELLEASKELFGMEYTPLKIDLEGNIYLTFNDVIQVTNLKNEIIKTYCLNTFFEWNGVLYNSIESPALTEVEKEYKYEDDDSRKQRITEIRINKAEQTIQILTSSQEVFESKLSEIDVSLDGILAKVEQVQDFTREKTQIENLFLDDIAIGNGYMLNFKIYGDEVNFNTKNITICASTKPRGYGDNISLFTEDNQELTTEENSEIVIGSQTYYLQRLPIILDDILRSKTVGEETYYDTLEIKQDGTIIITRNIGVNEDGNTYILSIPKIKTLDEKFVLPSETETYYFIEEIANLQYYGNYIVKNNLSDNYITKHEAKALLELKVDAEKLISEINASADVINLKAGRMIIDSENLKVTRDGKIESKAGNIGGFDISSTNLKKEFSLDYKFTIQDVYNLLSFLNGTSDLNSGLQSLYDMNGDNTLNITDVVQMINVIKGTSSVNKKINGYVSISSDDTSEVVEIDNDMGIEKTKIGLFSIFSHILNCDTLFIGEVGSDRFLGTIIDAINKTITVQGTSNSSSMTSNSVNSQAFNNNSLKEMKKNIEIFEPNIVEILENSEIYEFNYNDEQDTDKKHIGFVIGEEYKTPDEVLSNDKKSVDLYSMTSILWKHNKNLEERLKESEKAIKKMQELLQQMETKLKENNLWE